ncbi:MAG: diacylglycerol kinase family lipid kinase [Thermotogae bacterium]|nr:diacylglycerol kinase family lipid kinase [Thermotogota bacterium]
MKVQAIVNPVSRSGKKVFKAFKPLLKGKFVLEETFTEYRGHATELAAESDAELIFVFGGDGTLNEVVNGLVHNVRFPLVAPTFGGSGCDIARSLKIEKNPKRRVEEVIRKMESGGSHRVFLSRVDTADGGRFFIGVSDAGFGAEVALRFDRWRRLGRMGYAIAVLETLKNFKSRKVRFRADDDVYSMDITMVVFARTPYFGGGMLISPNSDPVSREAKVILLKDVGKLRFLANFPKVYSGEHLKMDEVVELTVKNLYIDSPGLPVEAEGEFVGRTPAIYTITEAYVNFV